MEQLYKLYASVARRRSERCQDASPPQLQHDSSTTSDATLTELPQLPRQPAAPYFAHNSFLGNASSDDIAIKPRKLSKLGVLTRAINVTGGTATATATTNYAAASGAEKSKSELLDHFLALPPELQLHVLSYLDFGDMERLRRTCRFFRAQVNPPLVRSLLAQRFESSIRWTCRLCLKQHDAGAALVSTDRHDPRFPLSSRCVECVWAEKGFDVGRKYLMASNVAVFVCRWCGRPVTSQPAWNQPEFHKQCFKRYTHVVFLYYLIGLAQWILVFIASGMCWHQFGPPNRAIAGIVGAGFVVTLWNFCLNSLRGTIMRTYHFALMLESLIFASWIVPLLALFHIHSSRSHRPRGSYETATVVFIIFNLVFRGINIVGNAILVCEYKLWRHKKPQMSPARSAWIHTLEVFIFFVEPQCVEQEYPAKWWFRRRRPAPPPEADDRGPEVVGVLPGEQQPGVGPYVLETDHNNLPVP